MGVELVYPSLRLVQDVAALHISQQDESALTIAVTNVILQPLLAWRDVQCAGAGVSNGSCIACSGYG